MKLLNKTLTALTLAGLTLASFADTKLVVAASPVPHAEILEFVKPYLKEKGVDLEVKVFTDYVQPNVAVTEGKADANFFQHIPYLTAYNKDHGTNIIPGFEVHIEPFAAYSTKYKKLEDLPKGALVAIPNDPANTARALLLLQQAGLITLKDPNDILATERAIVDNPKKLKIKSFEAANLPRVLNDVDLDLINANYALKAGLNPVKDSLVYELKGPYANLIAYLPERKDSPEIKLLEQALNRQEVKDFILTKYSGTIVPVFAPAPAAK